MTVNYFDANNLPVPGAKVCNDVVISAGASVQFGLPDQCTLEPGSHFGILTLADSAGTSPIVGYSRTENNAASGFSIEGFPITNFTSNVSNAVGLRQSAAPPTYQTNCFLASLGGAVNATTLTTYAVSGVTTLPAETYNVGVCATPGEQERQYVRSGHRIP
ncbi:MAG TPA: hypothetical protein VLG08_03230 [Casimicrobiaceae bacterium]|nr:hypothetical protein [Casimicrobiaceae bacterium]